MRARALLLTTLALAGAADLPGQAILGRQTGLAHPTFTITFNDLPSGFLGTVGTVDFAPVLYGAGWQVMDPTTGASCTVWPPQVGFPTPAAYNACLGLPFGTNKIHFNTPVTGVAFNVMTFRDRVNVPSYFEASLGGQQVASFAVPVPLSYDPKQWYGFEGVTFDTLDMWGDIDLDFLGMAIDNLQVQVAPEPGVIALTAVGLLALGAAARRRPVGSRA